MISGIDIMDILVHLASSFQKLMKEGLVYGLDCSHFGEMSSCEPCVDKKQHHSKFPLASEHRARNLSFTVMFVGR